MYPPIVIVLVSMLLVKTATVNTFRPLYDGGSDEEPVVQSDGDLYGENVFENVNDNYDSVGFIAAKDENVLSQGDDASLTTTTGTSTTTTTVSNNALPTTSTTTTTTPTSNLETTVKPLSTLPQPYTTLAPITVITTTAENEVTSAYVNKEDAQNEYDDDAPEQQLQPSHYTSVIDHSLHDSLESESEYINLNVSLPNNGKDKSYNNTNRSEKYQQSEGSSITTDAIGENVQPTSFVLTTVDVEHNRNQIDENVEAGGSPPYFIPIPSDDNDHNSMETINEENNNNDNDNNNNSHHHHHENENNENEYISSTTKSYDLDNSYVTKNSNLNNNFNNNINNSTSRSNFNNNNNDNNNSNNLNNDHNNHNHHHYNSNHYNNETSYQEVATEHDDIDDVSNQAILTSTSTTTELPAITKTTLPSSTLYNTRSTSASSTLLTTKIKQSKQIEVIEMRSADKILSSYVEDIYLRSPIAILVNQSPESLIKTQILWQSTLRPNAAMDFILISYNVTGVSQSIVIKNTRSLINNLNNISPTYNSGNGVGLQGVIRSSQEIPYDSAIFMSTNSVPSDGELLDVVTLALIKKRIRFYLIWFGEWTESTIDVITNTNSIKDLPTKFLGELAIRTGGRILNVLNDTTNDNNSGLYTLFANNDLCGTQEHTFALPIAMNINFMYIKMHGNFELATLETPNGIIIDLLNANTVNELTHSESVNYLGEENEYFTVVKIDVQIHGEYNLKTSTGEGKADNCVIEVDVVGKSEQTATADNVAFLQPLNDVFYNEFPDSPKSARQVASDIDSDAEELYESDGDGREEVEISGRQTTIQAVTKIDIGIQSQLLAAPGSTINIYYEVTNLRAEPTYHNFQVADELRYLRQMTPTAIALAPGQTSTVVVSAIIPPNAEVGTRDKITFTSQGLTTASQAAYVTVSTTGQSQDTYRPDMWYTYGSRCSGKTAPGTCAGGFWSLEITARDYESGLLRISSTPPGIIIRNSFVAGTREEVKATYSASCCQPRVTITAYDLNRNQRSRSFDVVDIYLTDGDIAAIVLGCILFIVLVIFLIFCICACIRRRKASRDLPVYTGERRATRSSRSQP